MFVFFATVFLKKWYWLFRFWRTCIQNFVRWKNMYSKYMYMTALLSQIIRTCGNTNLEIFFAEKIYNVAVIPIISYIFNLFYLIYFVLKELFFLSFFILVDMLIKFCNFHDHYFCWSIILPTFILLPLSGMLNLRKSLSILV